jgi:hypothetical protein
MKFVIPLLIATLIAGPALAQPVPVKVGDKAKNLLVIPPWTMKKCPKEFHATYTKDGAKLLRMRDNDCNLWRTQKTEQAKQLHGKDLVITKLKAVNESHETSHKLDQSRIKTLTKQLNENIAEKNKYKYKPNYGWLYITIGAAVALAGLCFGVGVWVAKE